MSKANIYCFSGTGNSLYAAVEIQKALCNATLIPMNSIAPVSAIDADVIGFIFPVHHWTMPELVKSYIEALDINPAAYIFGIASCGGIVVNALNDLEALMNDKSATLSYSAIHNNVASYVAAYEPFPKPDKTLPIAEQELQKIIQDVCMRKKNKPAAKSFRKEMLRVIGNYYIKRLPIKDTGFKISMSCNACGLCERICPSHNIKLSDRPTFLHRCTQCMSCIAYCPQGAINYKNKTQSRCKYHNPNIAASDLVDFYSKEI